MTFSFCRNISDQGFDLSLQGSLTGTGPLDALIEFTEPVTVNWNGNDIATIALLPSLYQCLLPCVTSTYLTILAVCAAANDGVPNYSTNAHLTITDDSKYYFSQLLE